MGTTPNIGPKGALVHDKDAQGITSTTASSKRALDVNIAATDVSVGGGVQYTEGDTDASITGTAMMAENALSPDELRPLQVTNDDNLKISIAESTTNVSVTAGSAFPVTDNAGSLTVDPGSGTWDDATITGLGDPLPINASLQGYSDGTNLQAARVFDLDSGAGSQYVLGVNLRSTASGGSFEITGADLTNSNPLHVAIVDGSGTQITSFGGGTQYTEGDVDASITGTAMMWEDAGNTLRSVSTATPLPIQGNVASGAAAAGNPVQLAGRIRTGLTGAGNVAPLVTAPDGDLIVHQMTGSVAFVDDVSNTQRIPVNETDEGFFTYPVFPYYFDGTTWDRVRGTSTDGLLVNLGANNDVTVTSGTITANQGTSPWVTADNQTITDNAGFTDGTSKVFTAGFIFDETAGTALTENDAAAARVDSKRAIVNVIEDATTRGRRQTVTAAGNAQVDVAAIAGTTTAVNNGAASAGTQRVTLASDSTGNIATIGTSVTPGTGATNLGKAEDGASANGDTLVGVAAIRRDTPVANANVSADGDYTQFLVDNLGKLWIAPTQTEDAAHASGDRGSFSLGVRNTANSTLAGTDGDYAPIAVDIMSGTISGIRRSSTTLTAINTTYNTTSTETNTSATVDCSMFRRGSFCATVTETGAATDITFTLQFSNDGGTTWFDYRVGPWAKYRFDDATIAAHGSNQLKICEPFECVAPNCRMSVTATGLLSGTDEFVVANSTFEFIN